MVMIIEHGDAASDGDGDGEVVMGALSSPKHDDNDSLLILDVMENTVVSPLPALETLAMSWCPLISDTAIQKFIKHLPQVSYYQTISIIINITMAFSITLTITITSLLPSPMLSSAHIIGLVLENSWR